MLYTLSDTQKPTIIIFPQLTPACVYQFDFACVQLNWLMHDRIMWYANRSDSEMAANLMSNYFFIYEVLSGSVWLTAELEGGWRGTVLIVLLNSDGHITLHLLWLIDIWRWRDLWGRVLTWLSEEAGLGKKLWLLLHSLFWLSQPTCCSANRNRSTWWK